jgi:hypothetical protein
MKFCCKYRALQRSNALEQWYSTWGTRTPGGKRKHLRGYVKFKIYILFYDKHSIISNVIYLIYFRCRLYTMYNLNYTSYTNILGGTWNLKKTYILFYEKNWIISNVIYLFDFRCRLYTMYNLNYTSYTNILGGTWNLKENILFYGKHWIISNVIYLIYFRCSLYTMYNLNYTPIS